MINRDRMLVEETARRLANVVLLALQGGTPIADLEVMLAVNPPVPSDHIDRIIAHVDAQIDRMNKEPPRE